MILDVIVLITSILFLMASVWEYTKLKALETGVEDETKVIRSKVMETRALKKENRIILNKVREELARKVSVKELDSLIHETDELLTGGKSEKKVHVQKVKG
ncbi:Uncharacterised protein [uncultured archaeon]|nr:Uncharacterised protein [uncultured archaeon]